MNHTPGVGQNALTVLDGKLLNAKESETSPPARRTSEDGRSQGSAASATSKRKSPKRKASTRAKAEASKAKTVKRPKKTAKRSGNTAKTKATKRSKTKATKRSKTKATKRSKTKATKRSKTKATKRSKTTKATKRSKTTKAKPSPGTCSLTSLPLGPAARALWQAGLDQARAGGRPASLAVFDVDGFHEHVRALGLERGDALLRELAKRLRAALSDAAYLGRLGGDCFAVLLPGVTVEAALGLCEQTRRAASRRTFKLGRGASRREVEPTLSAGIAGLDRDGETLDELLGQALAALWRAKTQGGNRTSLPVVERKQIKTSYYEQSQLERLKGLAARIGVKESVLLREALEDLLLKHKSHRTPPQA